MKRSSSVLFLVLAALAMPIAAAAQTTSGCFANFNIEPSSWNKADGADVQVGQIYHVREGAVPTSIGTNLNSGVTTEPLVVKMQPKLFLSAEGGCVAGSGLGFEVYGYRYKSDGSLMGAVTQDTSSNNDYRFSGIQMWDNIIPPALNKFQPGGRSPVPYSASADLGLTRFDADGIYNFINSNQAIAGVFGGLAILRYGAGRSEGEGQEGFLPDHFTRNGIYDALSFSAQSAIQGTMLGPTIGAQFTGVIGDPHGFGFALNARFSHAWLKGTLTESGDWGEFEQGYVGYASGEHGPLVFSNEEHVPLSRSGREAVQATDLTASARVRLFSGCLEVGPGITISRYDNLPMAASWSLPLGAPLAQSVWKHNHSNLTFSGIALSVGAKLNF